MRLLLIFISVLFIGSLYAANLELTRPKTYCGNKLTRIMEQFCLIYPALPDHRQKRQIATECCHSKCSLNYLLENYCSTVNTEALELFKLNSKNSDELFVTPPSQVRDRRRSSRFGQEDSIEEKEVTSRSRKGARGKRQCTCKKHQRKRKSKRSEMKILLRRRPPLPQARIGLIEDHQEPFYVGNYGK